MFRVIDLFATYNIIIVREVTAVKTKVLTDYQELKQLVEKADKLTGSSKLFIKVLDSLITAQSNLKDEDFDSLIKLAEELGAEELVSIFKEMNTDDSSVSTITVVEPYNYFTVNEVADMYGVSSQLVRRECSQGKFTAKKGKQNSWLIEKGALEENDIVKRWAAEKESRLESAQAARYVLGRSDAFKKGLKKTESNRKEESN